LEFEKNNIVCFNKEGLDECAYVTGGVWYFQQGLRTTGLDGFWLFYTLLYYF